MNLQNRCQLMRCLKRNIPAHRENWPKQLQQFKRNSDKLIIVDNVLLYKNQDKESYVVPFVFLVEMMLVVHYEMAHLGKHKLIELVSQHVWHPKLSKIGKDITQPCDLCQRMKVASIVQPPM